MTTYIYLTNRKIVTDSEGIIIESNVSTKPLGMKLDKRELKFIKAVGWKELKDGKRIAIKVNA